MSELAAFDAAVAAELERVSHVPYDSHEICKHFADELRKRLALSGERRGWANLTPLPEQCAKCGCKVFNARSGSLIANCAGCGARIEPAQPTPAPNGEAESARRLSIDELQKMLESEDDVPIQIMPNGEIRQAGEPTEKKPLTMRENLGGEYAKPNAEAGEALINEAILKYFGSPIVADRLHARKGLLAQILRDVIARVVDQRPAPASETEKRKVKRWPFVESPGEFADRLTKALGDFDGYVLGAVRNVLIENPPELCAQAPASEALKAVEREWLRQLRATIESACQVFDGWKNAEPSCWTDYDAQVRRGLSAHLTKIDALLLDQAAGVPE